MITQLFNKINKRKYSYKTYLLQDLSSQIESIISSPLLGEGNVSFQLTANDKQLKIYATVPNGICLEAEHVKDKPFMPKMSTLSIQLASNNFFTINTLANSSLEEMINELSEITSADEYLTIKMIIKKAHSQINKFVNQYEQYVCGVDNPSSNVIMSNIQSRLINNDNNEKIKIPVDIINLIENKNIDQHYLFQMFIGMKYDTKDKENLVEGVVRDIFDQFAHLNMFNIERIKYDEEVFSSEEMIFQYDKQYIAKSEICSLFSKNTSNLTENEQNQPLLDENMHKIDENSLKNEQIIPPESTYAKDTLPSIELLPVQIETNDDDVDKEIPNRIKNALKRVRIVDDARKVKLIDFKVGASLIKTTISIPSDKNFTDVKKKSEDIQAALGVDSLSIDQGEVADSVSFFIPRTNKQPIYLRTLLENNEFIKFAEKYPLPFIVGVDPLGNPIYTCLSLLVHLLCSGGTGGGKSVFLNQSILTLLMLRMPSELLMYLIDPKQVEFEQFNGFPQVVKVLDDMNKANKLLESLIIEMEKRYTTMKEGKVKNLWDYNTKYPDKKIPYIVVVIDEYADLKTVNPTVDDYIARLGQKARASGIHLIVATQRPDVKVIEGTTKANLPSKISFKLDSSGDYKTIFDGKPPVIPTGQGHGVMRLNGQVKAYEQFQGAIITIDSKEEEKVFENIKKSFKGEKVEGIKIENEDVKEEEVVEEPIIKMKRIIAEHGECRVGELRKLMEMNINVVTDLMHELANEGWLVPPDETNRKWKMNEECDELNKLRQLYGGN